MVDVPQDRLGAIRRSLQGKPARAACRALAHVRDGLPRFETFHYTQQRYAKLGSHTPWEVHTAAKCRLLSRRFALHRQGVLWREGRVAFTRLTDDQGRVRFFEGIKSPRGSWRPRRLSGPRPSRPRGLRQLKSAV